MRLVFVVVTADYLQGLHLLLPFPIRRASFFKSTSLSFVTYGEAAPPLTSGIGLINKE